MIVHHPADLQIFYRYQSEAVYNTAGVLVREIVPSPRRTLVHPSYNLAPPGSVWRVLLLFAEFAEARCALARAFCSVRKKRGLGISSPVERVANERGRRQSPPASAEGGRGVGSHSQETVTYHLPVLLLRMHTVLGVPSRGRCNTTCTGPTLDRCRVLLPLVPVL